MQITFMDSQRISFCTLPNKIRGQYNITQATDNGFKKNILEIEAVISEGKSVWIIKSSKYAKLYGENNEFIKEKQLEINKNYRIFLPSTNEDGLLFANYLTDDKISFEKYNFNKNDRITIGKSESNDIIYYNDYVSREHATLDIVDGKITIIDNDSTNGIFLNNYIVTKSTLAVGDIVYILGLKIIIGLDFIAINDPDGKVKLNQNKLRQFKSEEIIVTDDEWDDDPEDDTEYFSRSPRFKKEIIKKEFKIDSPPQVQNPPGTPLVLMLGPSMTMGLSSLLMGYFTVQNVLRTGGSFASAMPSLSISFCMLIGMILWPILTKRYEKRKKDEREAKRQNMYIKYLNKLDDDIKNTASVQCSILRENFITLSECITLIRKRDIRLWSRQYSHNDFLNIRLGLGTLPMFADFKYAERKFTIEDDNLQDRLYELVDRPKILTDVPIVTSFIKDYIMGIIGNRNLVKQFVKGLIFQLAALHSYDDLKMVFIFDENEIDDWGFAKWLPHVFDDNKEIRFIGTNQDDIKELSAYLENIFNYRKVLSDKELKEEKEHYLIISMSKQLSKKSEIVKLLLEWGKKKEEYIGFSLLALYDEVKYLPKECSCAIEIETDRGKVYSDYNFEGNARIFNPDNHSIDNCEQLAIDLLNTYLDSYADMYQLPEMYTFLEMYKGGKIEHLNILTRWAENNPVLSLKAPIGVDSYGDLFYLDLHQKFHGPHGLIAGMTGSGKSEFIMTYILSMAINYHPYEVAFILIDFKGGGMADTFDNLPHVAGKITNLDGALMNRSLISIESELKRRQKLFSEVSNSLNISNVDIYKYQQLFREGKVSEPIQHLIIISDEFAELKTQQPEFMAKLISAARIGRSLGVHLILATQKPSGVVDDQIWSNSKFRICLKVQEKADSMDMIKRPEAANITVTGRYYIQVGYNEIFEIGQSAWAGAPYIPSDKYEEKTDDYISIIDNLGRELRRAELDKKQRLLKEPAKQIDKITKYISQLAKEDDIEIRRLWLEPIDEYIYIDEIIDEYNYEITDTSEINPVVGVLDDPENQRQLILTVPISKKGNVILYGASGSGKETFLYAIMYSFIKQNSPKDINIYILDFGSQTLKAFEQAPHVGDVVFSDETEKVHSLFKRLTDEMVRRRKLVANYGGNIEKYKNDTQETLESIVVIINNYAAFSELYEQHLAELNDLTANGTKYGIYFVLTANTTNTIRYRLVQNFNQLFTLRFNDISEYSSLLGNTKGLLPLEYKGRGLVKLDKIYEYQIARITKDVENDYEYARRECSSLKEKYKGIKAPKIPILPDTVNVEFFESDLQRYHNMHIPIGVDKISLQPVEYDLLKSCVHLISSSNEDGIDFTKSIADILNRKSDSEVYMIDPRNVIENNTFNVIKDLDEAAKSIFDLLVNRNNTYKDMLEENKEPLSYNYVTYVIHNFSDFTRKITKINAQNLSLALEKNEIQYNVRFIIFDTPTNIMSLRAQAWLKRHCHNKVDIWLGDGILQYTSIVELSGSQQVNMREEIGSKFGYYINKGKVKLIKIIK